MIETDIFLLIFMVFVSVLKGFVGDYNSSKKWQLSIFDMTSTDHVTPGGPWKGCSCYADPLINLYGIGLPDHG